MPPINEHQLVTGALAGASDPLLRYLNPIIQQRVGLTILKHGRSSLYDIPQAKKDICQDVFLCLYDKNAMLLRGWRNQKGSLKSFVRVIAERRTIDYLRKKRPTLLTDEDILTNLGVSPSFGTRIEHQNFLQILLERVRSRVTEENFNMLEMLFLEDLDVAEIQQKTGKTPAAIYKVKSRLIKVAIQEAKKLMSGHAPLPRTPKKKGGPE